MLYLDRVSLHNFKSFRSATIRFSKGFNCIVGPNGSGKSNICDSLLFAFGENSLRRIRVTNSTQLINDAAKPNPDDGIRKAWVSVKMSGDSDVEIVRHIKSNNKVGYRLNGKHATRQEVIDMLRANRGGIEITNTITQGEIIRVLNLNAKERRGLIDVAAGIREFDEKKEASMKELEKVEEKINGSKIMLNERMGFLNELEKEKADAERYIEMTSALKRVNYTMLKLRESQLTEEFSRASDGRAEAQAKRQKIEENIAESGKEISRLSSEKEKKSGELNKRSIEVNSTNHIIEEIAKDIAVKEERIRSLGSMMESYAAKQKASKNEKADLSRKSESNRSEIDSLRKEAEGKLKILAESEVYKTSEESETNLAQEYENVRAEIESVSQEIEEIQAEHSHLLASIESSNARINSLKEELQPTTKERSALESYLSSATKEIEMTRKESEKKRALLKELEGKAKEIAERAGATDLEILRAKEKVYVAGASDKTLALLKKNMPRGFYGRVKDLCEFDEKDSNAIYASAQSRINYFVVDTIEDANKAIDILKKNGSDRASFIPLEDIRQSSRAKITSLKPIIELVKYDKKFSNAIGYVFSDTYLVESVPEAKKAGIGKARFVTPGGELVESSGVVTGGLIRQQPSLASLNSKLESLQRERSALSDEAEENSAKAEKIRKEIADYEVKLLSKDSEYKRSIEELKKLDARMTGIKNAMGEAELGAGKALESLTSLKEKAGMLGDKKAGLKTEETRLYSIISGKLSETRGRRADKETMEKIKLLRSEIEQMKMKMASLEKEDEMIGARSNTISSELATVEDELGKASAESKSLKEDAEKLSTKKRELETTIRSHDSESASLYKLISQYEEKISALSFEKGKSESELSKIKDKMQEYEMIIAQAQTRLGDIKVELMSYQNVQQLDIQSLKALEEKAAVLKNEIEVLGAVNLKAPEMYAERKKMVEEASQKLSTLENEKNSILSIIDEVESKKLNIFNETLAKVNANFSRLYSTVFEGNATLALSDPKDPFNSGLVINLPAKGKVRATLESKSGGEKSLISLILLFSIQLMNPMSFYIFDEIDSALDEENSIKLSKLTKELSKNSQFIVVSHNNALIQGAETAIGVMKQDGESKVVGIQIEAVNGSAAPQGVS